MTGCDLCGVGPEDDCTMDCASRYRYDRKEGLIRTDGEDQMEAAEVARRA
jgi:hypothetical protein